VNIWNCSKKFVKKHINDIHKNDSLRVISINDFGFAPFNFGDDRQKSLILYFDDAIPIDGIYDSLIFNERMARDILNFAINASRDGKELLVHCTAGISRSSAVSINLNNFINKILVKNLEDWEENIKHGFEFAPIPNPHVSSVMNRVISDYLSRGSFDTIR